MIKYLVLDVDGTLTDGGVYYDESGNELKRFNTKDGTGIICARAAGIKVVVLTGRKCFATTRRMEELHVDYIYQDIKDKKQFLAEWMKETGIEKEDLGYIGDDINDIGPMKLCGFIACPSDAIEEVKEISDYIAKTPGGYGVVREVIKAYFLKNNLWYSIIEKTYGTGT